MDGDVTDLDEIKTLLTPPARRVVNEMKLQISEMSPGVHVGATFVNPIFGIYTMWGDIALASHGDLVLGGFSIESKGKPANDVVRLDTSGQSTPASGPGDVAPSLEHGTIVRATFTDRRTTINVVGPAVVATHAPMIGIGAWVLAYKGKRGVLLQTLDILAAPGALGIPCPAPIPSWHDATVGLAN